MYVRPKHPYIQNKNKQVIKRFENKHIIKCMEIKQGDKKQGKMGVSDSRWGVLFYIEWLWIGWLLFIMIHGQRCEGREEMVCPSGKNISGRKKLCSMRPCSFVCLFVFFSRFRHSKQSLRLNLVRTGHQGGHHSALNGTSCIVKPKWTEVDSWNNSDTSLLPIPIPACATMETLA